MVFSVLSRSISNLCSHFRLQKATTTGLFKLPWKPGVAARGSLLGEGREATPCLAVRYSGPTSHRGRSPRAPWGKHGSGPVQTPSQCSPSGSRPSFAAPAGGGDAEARAPESWHHGQAKGGLSPSSPCGSADRMWGRRVTEFPGGGGGGLGSQHVLGGALPTCTRPPARA